MATLLEKVARARDKRAEAEELFRSSLRTAHESHSWAEIATVAGLSPSAVRYLAEDLNERRKENG